MINSNSAKQMQMLDDFPLKSNVQVKVVSGASIDWHDMKVIDVHLTHV